MAIKQKQQQKKRKQQRKEQRMARQQNVPLTPEQEANIQQRTQQDYQLGQTAGGLLDDIGQQTQQPFDWGGLPEAPGQSNFEQWRQQQIDAGNAAFDARMNPIFQRKREDLEQWAYNTGNLPGSPQYKARSEALAQEENDARQQGYFQNLASSGQNAEQMFGLGNTARSNALQEALMARQMPLNEFNQLNAARSGFDAANLAYGQQYGLGQQQFGNERTLQQQQFRNQMALQQSAPRGGSDPFMGFGSAQGLWSAQDQRELARQKSLLELQRAYAPKQPSYGAQLGGSILGTGLGLLGSYAMSQWK